LLLAILAPDRAAACPFCGPVGEPLARQRDSAAIVCVGEPSGAVAADGAGLLEGPFRILQVMPRRVADSISPPAEAIARVAGPGAGTAALFASADDPPRWRGLAADEVVLAHIMAAPSVEEPIGRRLAWYARRLEHPEKTIAEDAFVEFARAPYADVRAVAQALSLRPLAAWVADPGIDQRRRGFYGLALGIVAAERLPTGSPASSAPLREALGRVAGDFRAGSDGLMAGILVADGPQGLEWLLERAGPERPVDQRQLLAALRFAHEDLRETLPEARIVAATATLARSAAVAADAIVDLARLGAWGEVDAVAAWWDRAADDPLIRRAVAGYLLACPEPAGRRQLERLRDRDPEDFERARAAAELPRGQ
jgi:hypothetical protein